MNEKHYEIKSQDIFFIHAISTSIQVLYDAVPFLLIQSTKIEIWTSICGKQYRRQIKSIRQEDARS